MFRSGNEQFLGKDHLTVALYLDIVCARCEFDGVLGSSLYLAVCPVSLIFYALDPVGIVAYVNNDVGCLC